MGADEPRRDLDDVGLTCRGLQGSRVSERECWSEGGEGIPAIALQLFEVIDVYLKARGLVVIEP